jgi:plastocyanin
MRLAIVLVTLAACGTRRDSTEPARDAAADSTVDGMVVHDGAMSDATHLTDAAADAAVMPDAFPSKLDVRINCHNDCTLIANPASISVSPGTEFTVNWINTGDTDCDVAKIDQFNQVPIVLGLEPGNSYYDSVRQWCGQFTGTFEFQISICTIPSYIPVNCGA